MIEFAGALALLLVGTVALLFNDNLIKKVIGLGIFTDGIHLFLISIGWRGGGIAPILSDISFRQFSLMVDPVPQALVLTSIVIDLSVTAVALAIIVQIHKHFGTLSAKKLGSGPAGAGGHSSVFEQQKKESRVNNS